MGRSRQIGRWIAALAILANLAMATAHFVSVPSPALGSIESAETAPTEARLLAALKVLCTGNGLVDTGEAGAGLASCPFCALLAALLLFPLVRFLLGGARCLSERQAWPRKATRLPIPVEIGLRVPRGPPSGPIPAV